MKTIDNYILERSNPKNLNQVQPDPTPNIVFNACEVILFKGTFEKQNIGGLYRWYCDISLGEAYIHTGEKYTNGGFTVSTEPIEISEDIYEALKTEILKIEKQKDMLVTTISAIAKNETKKLNLINKEGDELSL